MKSFVRSTMLATALVFAASTAQAQAAAESRFGVKAGIALPMGDFADAAGLGFHVGGHVGIPLKNALSLRIDADYGRYSGEDDLGIDNASLLGGVVNLVYKIETQSELKPYILGGLGFYNWKFEGGGVTVDDSDLAFNVGVGYDFKMGGKSLFTELRFLSVQTDGDALNTLPIVIGLRF